MKYVLIFKKWISTVIYVYFMRPDWGVRARSEQFPSCLLRSVSVSSSWVCWTDWPQRSVERFAREALACCVDLAARRSRVVIYNPAEKARRGVWGGTLPHCCTCMPASSTGIVPTQIAETRGQLSPNLMSTSVFPGHGQLLWAELAPPHSYVDILTPSISECDSIWR